MTLAIAFMEASQYDIAKGKRDIQVDCVEGEFVVNIYDISNLAGVSISTVSRVLNADPNVDPRTRDKICEIIQLHKYVPKQRARNFSRSELQAVGLLIDDIRNPYMAELAYAINQELSKWKVSTILCDMSDVERAFINQVDNLINRRVNGIILLGSVFRNEICRVAIERRYSGFPFVSLNGGFELPNVFEVMQDQVQGTVDAVRHLCTLGKRRIGWVYFNKSSSDKRKSIGFHEGMQECGLKADRTMEINEKTLMEGKRVTAAFLEKYPDTDAIMYSADIVAVGGAHYLNDAGISVPGQIAVIGFNNSRCAQECYPPLTSIDNQLFESGKATVQIMMRVLNKEEVEDVIIPCGLAVRESTSAKGDNIHR